MAAPELAESVRSAQIAGNTIAYFDRGQGPALLLQHGMFGDFLDWEPVLEPLSRRFRVIATDLPGFGQSSKPAGGYTIDFFADAVQGVLDHLEVERVVLVGNSFGGAVVSTLAARQPARVAALVLVSSAGLRPYTPEARQALFDRFTLENLLRLTPEIQAQMFSVIFAREGPWRRRYVDKQNAKLARPDWPDFARTVAACRAPLADYDAACLVAALDLPVLLLWGDEDQVFPPEIAEAMLPRLRQGSLRYVKGAGHAPQLDDPEGFVRRILEFLEPVLACQ